MFPVHPTGSTPLPASVVSSIPSHSNVSQTAASFDTYMSAQQITPNHVSSSRTPIASPKIFTATQAYLESYARMHQEASLPFYANNLIFTGGLETISADTTKTHLTNERHYNESFKSFADEHIEKNKIKNKKYGSINNNYLKYKRLTLLTELENLSSDIGKKINTLFSDDNITIKVQKSHLDSLNFPKDPTQKKMLALRNMELLVIDKQKINKPIIKLKVLFRI